METPEFPWEIPQLLSLAGAELMGVIQRRWISSTGPSKVQPSTGQQLENHTSSLPDLLEAGIQLGRAKAEQSQDGQTLMARGEVSTGAWSSPGGQSSSQLRLRQKSTDLSPKLSIGRVRVSLETMEKLRSFTWGLPWFWNLQVLGWAVGSCSAQGLQSSAQTSPCLGKKMNLNTLRWVFKFGRSPKIRFLKEICTMLKKGIIIHITVALMDPKDGSRQPWPSSFPI